MTTLSALTEPPPALRWRSSTLQPRRRTRCNISEVTHWRSAARQKEAEGAPPLPPPHRSVPGTWQREPASHQDSADAPDWRQRAAAAGAAAVLVAQALVLSPLEATAASSPTTAAPQAIEQQRQTLATEAAAEAMPAAPSILDQDPAAVVAGLPPLPTEFPQLPPLALPKYQQITLKNGLRVFLLEDHELPVVRGSLLMRGGTRASPDDKVRRLPHSCWLLLWHVGPAPPTARSPFLCRIATLHACLHHVRASPALVHKPCWPSLASPRAAAFPRHIHTSALLPHPARWVWPRSARLCSDPAAPSSTPARSWTTSWRSWAPASRAARGRRPLALAFNACGRTRRRCCRSLQRRGGPARWHGRPCAGYRLGLHGWQGLACTLCAVTASLHAVRCATCWAARSLLHVSEMQQLLTTCRPAPVQVVRSPAIPQDKLELAKTQAGRARGGSARAATRREEAWEEPCLVCNRLVYFLLLARNVDRPPAAKDAPAAHPCGPLACARG